MDSSQSHLIHNKQRFYTCNSPTEHPGATGGKHGITNANVCIRLGNPLNYGSKEGRFHHVGLANIHFCGDCSNKTKWDFIIITIQRGFHLASHHFPFLPEEHPCTYWIVHKGLKEIPRTPWSWLRVLRLPSATHIKMTDSGLEGRGGGLGIGWKSD